MGVGEGGVLVGEGSVRVGDAEAAAGRERGGARREQIELISVTRKSGQEMRAECVHLVGVMYFFWCGLMVVELTLMIEWCWYGVVGVRRCLWRGGFVSRLRGGLAERSKSGP